MSMELKAKLVMAIRGYKCEKRQKLDGGIDFTASSAKSGEKILLRVITNPKSKSGFVNIEAVRDMVETMEHEHCNKGVLISKRFTGSAKREMGRKNIQMVSEDYMPPFKPLELYLRIQDYIDNLCKVKCGRAPEKESDCKGYSKGRYSCKIRLISDNASFHFEHGWINLLKNDLTRLLVIENEMEVKKK